MSNPWLNIPLADYEGHMRSEEVQQLDALSELFAAALERYQPTSVAVLGAAGGNGLDRIDSNVTKRVVGLDLNHRYLDEARKRYAGTCNLSLHCVDLADELVNLEPVHLVHAALIFEHAGIDRCLENAVSLVNDGGALCAVLQLPSPAEQEIGSSDLSSILALKDNFTLVDPIRFQRKLTGVGFQLVHEVFRPVPAGKALWMGAFERC
ncbi:MAG TPA: class I SAM-dependent methyltransferase [Bryobacteraceae bacterium]|nr:class I SAM-dependent methyltransferase [Bryobacteraceae bacterium]